MAKTEMIRARVEPDLKQEAEEGGYWAEVPAIPGCATQGRTFDELLNNIQEAVEGCLSVDLQDIALSNKHFP